MFIQKTFHIHQNIDETRAGLANIGAYRRDLEGVRTATMNADGVGRFEIETPSGTSVSVDLVEIISGDQNKKYFRSVRGNVQMAGMIEFFAIKENFTEVVLSLDYEITSSWQRVYDALTGAVDNFLNEQLLRIQSFFEGMGTFAMAERSAPYAAHARISR